MGVKRSPFYNKKIEELQDAVGKTVVKLSGKPFQDCSREAVVESVVEHPRTGRPAFRLVGSFDAVEASALKFSQVDPHIVTRLRLAFGDVG